MGKSWERSEDDSESRGDLQANKMVGKSRAPSASEEAVVTTE